MGRRSVVSFVAGGLAVSLLLASPAAGQVEPPPTTQLLAEPAPGPLQVAPTTTTTTTAPPSPPPSKAPATTTPTTTPALPPPGLPDQVAALLPPDAGPFPPELQALVDRVRRTKAGETTALLAALASLERFGLDETARALVGFGAFPVAGPARWDDDWWTPRFGPVWRLHLGLDVAAVKGTPVRSPTSGTVHISNAGLGGLGVNVTQPDGTYWYLAHLSAIAPTLREGQQVEVGQVVGFVGDSGIAAGAPHVHIEVHPGGGAAVPPKPYLDRMVAEALAAAPGVVAAVERQAAMPMPMPTPTPVDGPVRASSTPDTDELVAMLLAPLTPTPLRRVLGW